MRTEGRFAMATMALCLLFVVSPARAGILATDNIYGMPLWHGSVPFVTDNDQLAVDVDYCVYAPGQFGQRFPGQDPSNGQRYIYAYQLLNTVDPHPDPIVFDYIKYFSVGLNSPGDQQAADVGFLAGSDVSPPVKYISPHSAVRWQFFNGPGSTGVQYGQVSDILIFSSPFAPTLDNATVSGATAATIALSLPSPMPEPASATLVLLLSLACRGRRKA